jgi:hypothetical protein
MLSLGGAHLAALNPLSSTSVLASLGALGVFLALFAETGLLIGFFLPGDSLLFTAGLLCTTGSHPVHLSLPVVILAAIGGALLGAQTGYYIGRGGRPLLGRSSNRFLRNGTERAVVVSLIPVGLELLRARRAGRGPDGDSGSGTGSGSGSGSGTGGSDATVRS